MPLIIHHLHVSQSERIPWLCEELGIPYELRTYTRAPLLAPAEYKALHPAGTAPVIQDGDLTLAESCACIEYICHKYAGGKLFLTPEHPAYAEFLYWWHWVNGTFQGSIGRIMIVRSAKLAPDNQLAAFSNDRIKRGLDALNNRLRDNEWLAGAEFTVADIMVVFTLTTSRYFSPYSLKEYGNVVDYLKRISSRQAYQDAMKKCDPGMELVLGVDPPKPFYSKI
ncbi:glutathione S-transferase [Xylogone sp. PMI_703]|nr:glutathione S-transferase [Xylogone sp. PMI_703]